MIETTIQDIAFGGDGVARHDGKAVFIPFTIEGEKVSAKITLDKKKFAKGELVKIIEPSQHRVEPECPYFRVCGGCSYQHIDYGHQLDIKYRQVEQTLLRVGRLASVPMRPMVASSKSYGFRNRIRVHIENGVTGFYAHGSHRLIDVKRCAIASDQVNEALLRIRGKSMYDGDYTLSENKAGRFFEQTNTEIGNEMLKLVEKMVKPGQSLLVDAYCGAGFFAKHLLDRFEKVTGIEENELAVAHAIKGATEAEQYLAGDVELRLPGALAEGDAATTTLVLDPPAIGISPRVADIILAAMPSEIIYVSCNPATLARDLAALAPAYQLLSVTPMDMFPQTAEIEAVAHLRK
jgi:23S rRNA (uracil1939-C5)-methyltransferase